LVLRKKTFIRADSDLAARREKEADAEDEGFIGFTFYNLLIKTVHGRH